MNVEWRKSLAAAKSAISRGECNEAFCILISLVSPDDDFVVQSRIAKVFAAINIERLCLRPIRIALLASTTVDHFADILRFWLARDGFAADIWLAPYDTMTPTILDKNSALYAFCPDIIWIFSTHRDIRSRIAAGDVDAVKPEVGALVESNALLWQTIQSRLNCAIIQNNADIPSGDPFGNYAGQAIWSQRNVLRRYNLDLCAAAPNGVVIFDLDHISSNFGRSRWIDQRYWYHSKHAFAFDACGYVAFQGARLITGLKGQAKKCLVLDLDNTLWGGVIGDDGLAGIKLGNGADGEAFVDFQKFALALKSRGIILAVCSKNEEENAKEPFIKHPDMKIHLDDIAVFRANWTNKADNIREIANILNIGLDAMVFVDDNPVERDLVREFLPMVAVPELPEDPSGYIQAIEKHSYFETAGFSPEDMERSNFYRDNAARVELKAKFADAGDYLRTLGMVSEKADLDDFHLPRMAQLINKSNQFHLTGTRYSDAELQALADRDDVIVRYYKLSDKFGDNGLISVVVLFFEPGADMTVDTWVMSCRVLGRSMEEFICNDLIATALRLGCRSVKGCYIPSTKNKLVSQLYHRLGFTLVSDDNGKTTWRLASGHAAEPLNTYIMPSK